MDIDFLGLHFCNFESIHLFEISGGLKYFHNGKRFIPGISIVIFKYGMWISFTRSWE